MAGAGAFRQLSGGNGRRSLREQALRVARTFAALSPILSKTPESAGPWVNALAGFRGLREQPESGPAVQKNRPAVTELPFFPGAFAAVPVESFQAP